MARIVPAALAVGVGLAALVGGTTTAHAADNAADNAADKTYAQLETSDGRLCLGASFDNSAYLDDCRTDWMFPAVWEVVATSDSSFELRWSANNNCLEVAGGGAQIGTQVRLGACSGGKQTRWQMDLVDPVRKLYQLRPTHAEDRCLDIPNGEIVQNKQPQSWSCNQSAAQLWHVKKFQWPST
ncbi:hypothetical protein ADK55_31535 [Streptomyces sp. WM4235]|uniref:RICIN domain-containing protein n=1 Tax=Streptomyces sp. WM4235 TaxID=1415551 RepID=UPI0006AF7D6A|nr:RICIN domain-containing protein [Streptomyces sp. WM4235]KOU40501.1 hypothetical protein ADK55_31535 [Streptomyces sp. WM4235]